MEHKDYKLEIVKELLKRENHIRGLAKQLNVNHMTILRKINKLFDLNVVDYKKEGKNKVYFLKKTLESRQFIYLSEFYYLVLFLKKYPFLRKIIDEICLNPKIDLALLFGSYAKNLETKQSDIDIYIETKDKKVKQKIENLNSKVNIKLGIYDKENLLIKEIEKNHVILKGVEKYYEKNKFFN